MQDQDLLEKTDIELYGDAKRTVMELLCDNKYQRVDEKFCLDDSFDASDVIWMWKPVSGKGSERRGGYICVFLYSAGRKIGIGEVVAFREVFKLNKDLLTIIAISQETTHAARKEANRVLPPHLIYLDTLDAFGFNWSRNCTFPKVLSIASNSEEREKEFAKYKLGQIKPAAMRVQDGVAQYYLCRVQDLVVAEEFNRVTFRIVVPGEEEAPTLHSNHTSAGKTITKSKGKNKTKRRLKEGCKSRKLR